MSDKNKPAPSFNRGARYGAAWAAIHLAVAAIEDVRKASDLLTAEERELLDNASRNAAGLAQLLSMRQAKEARR